MHASEHQTLRQKKYPGDTAGQRQSGWRSWRIPGVPVVAPWLLGLGVLLCTLNTEAALWITKQTGQDSAAQSTSEFLVLQGDYPKGERLTETPAAQQIEAYLVDPAGQIQPVQYKDGRLLFQAPLKGHHWLYFIARQVRQETLEIDLAKYRFYNAKGDIGDSLLKEVRGRTIDSKYGRPPQAQLPFEAVLQKPEREHHISCCLFSGDVARLKVYHDMRPLSGAALQVMTADGWARYLSSDGQGLAEFELPLTHQVNSSRQKFAKRHLLVSTSYTSEAPGLFNGVPYKQTRYTMTEPFMYHPSALEWAAKAPAFALIAGAALLLGLGVFLYRLRLRRRRQYAQ